MSLDGIALPFEDQDPTSRLQLKSHVMQCSDDTSCKPANDMWGLEMRLESPRDQFGCQKSAT